MLTSKRSKFTLPPQVTYLNCAYMSPLLKSAEKVGVKALRKKRNPVVITPEEFFKDNEVLRQEYAKLIHAKNPKQITTMPSVSYGMATVAKNISLRSDQNIIVAASQFPSNYYVWETLCKENGATLTVVAPPDDFINRGKRWNEKILDAINPSTKVVALGQVHWADGTRFDLVEIRKRTRDVGALLIIDGTQSVGALPFDVEKIQPDALICAGYKWLLGPYALGLSYFGEYFLNGKPLEENWIGRLKSEDFSGLVNYESRYQEGALRFDVGERSNFILVPMLINAIQQLNDWGPERIQEYCKKIGGETIQKLQAEGFIIEDEAWRGNHLLGIRLPAHRDIEKAKASLAKKKIYVSIRGNAIRIAPNVYNTEKDFQKLYKALTR